MRTSAPRQWWVVVVIAVALAVYAMAAPVVPRRSRSLPDPPAISGGCSGAVPSLELTE